MFFLDSIFIIYKWSKDTNYKNKNLKANLYYIALITILQRIYHSLTFIDSKEMNQ